MGFKTGDKVKVICEGSVHQGKTGGVGYVFGEDATCLVTLEGDGKPTAFLDSELEPADPEREALIELAETLERARLQAAIVDPVVESQHGVYRTVVLALHDVLEQIVGDTEDPSLGADKVYVRMFANGETVREALAAGQHQGTGG